jgi:hypothetical protein
MTLDVCDQDILKFVKCFGTSMTDLFTCADIFPADDDQKNSELERFCAATAATWLTNSINSGRAEDGFIIVDLMVRHAPYYLGNILIAKYLQRIMGGHLIGVVPSADHLSYRMMKISEAFGLKGFVSEPSGNRDLSRHTVLPSLFESLEGLSPEILRERILGLSVNGLRIGHLIYDSYMRWTLNGTVEEFNSPLKVHVAQAFEYLEFYSDLLNKYPSKSVVLGHMGYIRFGILARTALKRSIPVYHRTFHRPVAITRFDDLADADTHVVRYSGRELDNLYDRFASKGIPKARKFMQERITPERARNGMENIASSHGPGTVSLDADALSKQLGLDSTKPSVAIFGHVLTDSPHLCNWAIYHDYFQWFVETLDIIKDIEEINWIIRLHPDRVHYQETGERDLCQIALTEMVGQYKHVFDMPASIASSSLFKIVTAVVTADGTAGYEYPAMGIPCIIAGESRYSGNGFTIEPKNADEYRNELINVARLEPLSAVEINRALFFCYIFYFHSRQDSPFLTNVPMGSWVEYDEGRVWRELEESMALNSPEADPLFRALEKQVRLNCRFLGEIGDDENG